MTVDVNPEKKPFGECWKRSPTVDKMHYDLTIHTKDGSRQKCRASEWGTLGEILASMREVGENGKRRLNIIVYITAGKKIEGPAGESSGSKENEQDAMDIISVLRAMADLSNIYCD